MPLSAHACQPDNHGRAQPDGPYACLTVDIDSLACYRAIHGLAATDDDGPDPAYMKGVRRMLTLFRNTAVTATLFVVGRDAEHPAHRQILRAAADAGFELANHSYSHHYDLPKRRPDEQLDEIRRGEHAIARACGQRPVGYRAPGYNISPDLLAVLGRRDYVYDSSIFPCLAYYVAKGAVMAWQRLHRRPSRSAMTRWTNLFAPITAYRPSADHIWRRDAASELPVEIPMCLVPGIRLPVIGTSLAMMGPTGFDAALPVLNGVYKNIIQLEFHAIDFMDAADIPSEELVAAQPDLRIGWPKKRRIYAHVIRRLRETYRFGTLAEAVNSLP